MQEIKELNEHTDHQISQFRKIKETANESVGLRIDWSENATFFQSRQEKGAYYHSTQVSIHIIIGYMANDEVVSYGALSDMTSHRAPAVSASMKPLLRWKETFHHF